MRSRRGAFTVFQFLLLAAGAIAFLFVILPMASTVAKLLRGATSCHGDCLVSTCGEGYERDLKGDTYCKEQHEDQRRVCCLPYIDPEDQPFRRNDLKIYYNNDRTNPLADGDEVELKLSSDNRETPVYKGEFDIGMGKSLDKQYCYGQITLENGNTWSVPFDKLFSPDTLTQALAASSPGDGPDTIRPHLQIDNDEIHCWAKQSGGTRKAIDYGEISISPEQYFKIYGQEIQYEVVVVNRESCEKYEDTEESCRHSEGECKYYFDTCDYDTVQVNLALPEIRPVISLKMSSSGTSGERTLSPEQTTKLEPGETYNLVAEISQPLLSCSLDYDLAVSEFGPGASNPTSNTQISSLQAPLRAAQESFKKNAGNTCYQNPTYREPITLTIPPTMARGALFSITLNTSMNDPRRDNSMIVHSNKYLFQIAPDDQLIVNGPYPGLAREKNVDITCRDISCNRFELGYVGNPYACNAEMTSFGVDKDPNANQPQPYGREDSGMFRYTIKNESHNGQYVCIKAETDEGEKYMLGLANGRPAKITIDRTEPVVTLDYNSWKQVLEMECSDAPSQEAIRENPQEAPKYVSGCKDQPFSYAYITDPLIFIGRVVGGTANPRLHDSWDGCPDPYTSAYVPYRTRDGTMQILSNDVRVICVRGEDRAGNYNVESRILYSSPELLAALIMELQ